MNRRNFLLSSAAVGLRLADTLSCAGAQQASDAVLYNGIRLPSPWPPAGRTLGREPMPVPYLERPPDPIPVDVGRQLFVDDFLVEQTSLTRTHHAAHYHPACPVLKPDREWELAGGPTAMPFSDGVWYDPADGLFKMWYMGGYTRATCYATSRDGLHWEKPTLDVRPGTNIVHEHPRDSATVWLDPEDADPARRYKLGYYSLSGDSGALSIHTSRDGIHWGTRAALSGPCGDRTTFFRSPFRGVWVYSLREYLPSTGLGRCRRYWEHPDLVAGCHWKAGQPPLWVGADRLDSVRPDIGVPPELYNLDAVAYESLLLGLFSIWHGQPRDRAKPNEVYVGFSRDGFHWDRPHRSPFIPVSERYGDWNWANVQSAGGCCLVAGDELFFYVSGRAGVKGSSTSGVCSTGLAVLRRDGFTSMDAGTEPGTLTTRHVRFSGRHLFVNADASQGELTAEVVDDQGESVAPFTAERCVPVRANGTRLAVRWRGAADLGRLAGKPVRFRFHLRRGSLYAFWVTPDRQGASFGYVAAGGPGLKGIRDTA